MNAELRPTMPSMSGEMMNIFQQPGVVERMFCNTAIHILTAWLTFFWELILLPNQSTRYTKPLIAAIGWLVTTPVLVFSAMGGLPYGSFVLLAVFWVLLVRQGIRHGKLMANIPLEKHSELDGPGLGFMPGATWLRRRAFYEPMFALVLTVIGYGVGFLNIWLTAYLAAGAIALSFKALLMAYDFWIYKRIAADLAWAAQSAREALTGKPAVQEMPQAYRVTTA